MGNEVRKDDETGLFSVIDIVRDTLFNVYEDTGNVSSQINAILTHDTPDLKSKIQQLRINGKGHPTPVASLEVCAEIAIECVAVRNPVVTTSDNLWDNIRKDYTTGLFSVIDVIRAINGMKSKDASNYFSRLCSDLKSKTQQLRINGKGRLTPVASREVCTDIATQVLSGARMPVSTKDVHYETLCVPKHLQRRVHVECETIQTIQKVFHRHESVTQKTFGPYRVDLYFPEASLCIECDETQHKYAQTKDASRQRFIAALGMRFFRYRPCEASFDLAEVIDGISKALKNARENPPPEF